MRYALTEGEWQIIQPTLPRRSRGVPRVDDRRILNGIFWWPRADKSDLSRARSDEPTRLGPGADWSPNESPVRAVRPFLILSAIKVRRPRGG